MPCARQSRPIPAWCSSPIRTIRPAPSCRVRHSSAFSARCREDVLVVLDEAYNEYLDPSARYDSVAWLARFPNLVISRTFSKIYGLAGLRVGYAFAHPEVADLMNRVRQPFNVGSLGLAAAEAALDDEEFIRAELRTQSLRHEADRHRSRRASASSTFRRTATSSPFRVGDAAAVNQRLLRQGVIVRPIAGYGMPQHLRVSIGLEAENVALSGGAGTGARGLMRPISRLVVCGVGLIGGSAALALRAAGAVDRVVGIGRSRATLDAAQRLGVIDEIATEWAQALPGAEVVLIAAPVGQMEAITAAIAPYPRTGHHRHGRRQHQARRRGERCGVIWPSTLQAWCRHIRSPEPKRAVSTPRWPGCTVIAGWS